MACNSLSSPATRNLFRRSFSDNNICCSVSHVRNNKKLKLKSNRSTGNIFNLELSSSFIPRALRSLLLDFETRKEILTEEMAFESDADDDNNTRERSNWVERLLELRKDWIQKQKDDDENDNFNGYGGNEGCEVSYEDEDEEMNIDRKTFSDMLQPVSLSHTKLLSRLAFLCNIAYVIPKIKAKDLRRYYGLEFVTSSLGKKLAAETIKAMLEVGYCAESKWVNVEQKRSLPCPSVAYEIAASAASYVQSQSQSRSSQRVPYKSAAGLAASAVTAVVAAAEKKKEEAAMELQSLQSSPCDWFVCDDLSEHTRCFVIQGSDSLASWQANLLFEPTRFEDTDVLVHRGIYEAAKGIYEQFMPEIMQHLNEHGDKAKLQFTGHSLGGSLSVVVNLMLLTRKVVKPKTVLPVVTFGAPFVFCGGLNQLGLGLDENDVHCVMMHRDIVPRAFSCNYPHHVSIVLKRLNATFRSHPCLNKKKLLYSPMGKIFILQPDEKLSPPHPLLPTGSALYTFQSNCSSTRKALRAFLNSPHPLETLSHLTAYGSNGTILRDHDSSHYLRAVNEMIRKHKRPVPVPSTPTTSRNMHWPLFNSHSPHAWTQECTR